MQQATFLSEPTLEEAAMWLQRVRVWCEDVFFAVLQRLIQVQIQRWSAKSTPYSMFKVPDESACPPPCGALRAPVIPRTFVIVQQL